MDIKVDGLSYEILEKALLQAKEGREYILSKITECIAEPHADLKPHAPRIETMTIPKEFIGAVIGPGGKIIQGMQEETCATITIEDFIRQTVYFDIHLGSSDTVLCTGYLEVYRRCNAYH